MMSLVLFIMMALTLPRTKRCARYSNNIIDQHHLASSKRMQENLDFVVMNYNVLAKSLGSNCIPWVMTISQAWMSKVENYLWQNYDTDYDWVAFKTTKLMEPYRKFFHKNLDCGNFADMRSLWSSRQLQSQEDIPRSLADKVVLIAEDKISYVDSRNETISATTMRGVLRNELGEFGLQLFEHIVSEEDEVYAWAVRGPRLFRQITAGLHLKADGEPEYPGRASPPDIVVLEEYDIFGAEAEYLSNGVNQTFPQAMAEAGYQHAFYIDPLKTRDPPSGIGVFWRKDTFELAGTQPVESVLACGGEVPNSKYSFDMYERYEGSADPLRTADRRHVSFTRLRHKNKDEIVWVAGAHLMTDSRDSPKTNKFPGEIRAGELKTIREKVAQLIPPEEHLLFMGDFNIDAKTALDVFVGHIPRDDWRSSFETLEVATGFSVKDKKFYWRGRDSDLILQETFQDVHKWGAGVGKRSDGGHCTSINAKRVEWIDYIWHSELLQPTRLSNTVSPALGIPDRTHGSDHLPISAGFLFL